MNKYVNEEYLITLLKCALTDEIPPEKPEGASFEKIYETAFLHEVANVIFLSVRKLRGKPDDELYKKWEKTYFLAIKRDAEQEALITFLKDLFLKNGIKHLEVQGSAVKRYYPSFDLRMMSDTDVIVEREKLQVCKELLLSEGFTVTDENDEEIAFTDGINVLEIHTDFFYSTRTFQNSVKCSSVLSRPFEKACTTDGLTYYPSDTLLYLFNLLHCYKHFLSDGAGIRRIMDIFVLQNALKNVDYEYIGILLDDAKLGKTDDDIMCLVKTWFRGEKGDEKTREFSEAVFKAGNHGSREFLTDKKIKAKEKRGKKTSRISYAFSRFFINKNACYAIYPFCKKHRYPLFMCWIHRFNMFIFHPKKSFKALKELSYVKKSKKS